MSTTALKAAATGVAAPKPKTLWDHLEGPRFKAGLGAVASQYLTPQRMLSVCINAVKKTPRLMECNPQSVLGAMMTSAALGLEPNTVQQQAFLIPYKKRAKVGNQWVDTYDCQFQIGARGFVTLGYRSPHIRSMFHGAIHENDLFEQLQGSQSFLKYSVNLRGRGDLIGAFSHVILKDGGETACVLPLDELLKIRSRSETYRTLVLNVDKAENAKDREKAERQLAETPWVMWMDDMVAKSATKKHAKQLPIAAGDTLVTAAEIDSRADANTLDLAAMADPDVTRAVIADEVEPPALEDNPSPSTEAFGATARANAPEPVPAKGAPAPAQGQRRTKTPPPPAPAPAHGERAKSTEGDHPLTADQFIERIENAAGPQDADALLAQARADGFEPDEFKRIEQAYAIAWTDGAAGR